MENLITNLYNTSMKIAESVAVNGETVPDNEKKFIIDSIGALLEAVGIANFNGVYSIEQLKYDIMGV